MAMPPTNIADSDLIAHFKVKELKEQAFTQLVKKYQERLYWHIRRMVVVHDDAHDILQNVFIKVWRHVEGFRADSNLYTWLYRIATNETLTWIESNKKNNHQALGDSESGFSSELKAEKGYDARQIEWKLQQAILTLPDKQRIVFNLRYYDEMPYEEMSTVLDTSVGALKASYHHAAKKVENILINGL